MSTHDSVSLAIHYTQKSQASRKRLREEEQIQENAAAKGFWDMFIPLADAAAEAGKFECTVPFSVKCHERISEELARKGFTVCWNDHRWSGGPSFLVSWPEGGT